MTGRAVRHRCGITDRNDYGLLLTGHRLAQLDQQAARCAMGSRSVFIGRALGRHEPRYRRRIAGTFGR